MVEEFAQAAIAAIDEAGKCEAGNLVRQRRPRAVTILFFPGQHRFEKMHMRIGAKRCARRVCLLEAGDRVPVVALENGKDFEGAAAHLIFAIGKDRSCLRCGEKRKSLVVEIEGGIDQFSGLVGQVAVKAVFKAIDLLEPGQPVQHCVFPGSMPAMLAGGGITISLARLDAGAAVIGKTGFAS